MLCLASFYLHLEKCISTNCTRTRSTQILLQLIQNEVIFINRLFDLPSISNPSGFDSETAGSSWKSQSQLYASTCRNGLSPPGANPSSSCSDCSSRNLEQKSNHSSVNIPRIDPSISLTYFRWIRPCRQSPPWPGYPLWPSPARFQPPDLPRPGSSPRWVPAWFAASVAMAEEHSEVPAEPLLELALESVTCLRSVAPDQPTGEYSPSSPSYWALDSSSDSWPDCSRSCRTWSAIACRCSECCSIASEGPVWRPMPFAIPPVWSFCEISSWHPNRTCWKSSIPYGSSSGGCSVRWCRQIWNPISLVSVALRCLSPAECVAEERVWWFEVVLRQVLEKANLQINSSVIWSVFQSQLLKRLFWRHFKTKFIER